MNSLPRQPVTPDVPDVAEWTPEAAHAVEDLLAHVLGKLKTVIQMQGASYDKYGDYKICFEHTGSTNPLFSYFLRYKPEEKSLSGWASGISYAYPPDVIDHLREAFPHARYRLEPSAHGDGTHLWENLTIEELQRVAAGAKSEK